MLGWEHDSFGRYGQEARPPSLLSLFSDNRSSAVGKSDFFYSLRYLAYCTPRIDSNFFYSNMFQLLCNTAIPIFMDIFLAFFVFACPGSPIISRTLSLFLSTPSNELCMAAWHHFRHMPHLPAFFLSFSVSRTENYPAKVRETS